MNSMKCDLCNSKNCMYFFYCYVVGSAEWLDNICFSQNTMKCFCVNISTLVLLTACFGFYKNLLLDNLMILCKHFGIP